MTYRVIRGAKPGWRRETGSKDLARKASSPAEGYGLCHQAMLFGAGLLVSLLPFVILLSAFASQRVNDDISLRLGLSPGSGNREPPVQRPELLVIT